jgi:MFS family permease
VGPPAGSLLFSVSAAIPFVGNALAWATSAAVLSRLRISQALRDPGAPTSLLQDIVTGARWLFAQPILRALAVWAMFVNGSIAAFTAIEVLYALELLGVPEAVYGFYGTAAGLGGLTGTLLAGRVVARLGRARVVMFGSALHGLSALTAGLLPHPLLFAVLAFLMTAGASLVIIVLGSLRQTIVPSRLLGRVTATTRTFGYGALPLGAVVGGWLASLLDLRVPFLIGGVIIVSAGLLIGRWLSPEAIEAAKAAARAADGQATVKSGPSTSD